ncbi:MAG: phospho-N-acetylmuramoyl-pentapeptide-transferase [Verrucomicrobiales bacterium]
MLYWIYQITEGLHQEGLIYKLLNVCRYQTFRAAVACLLAFGMIVLTGEWVIRKLISLKVGQPIRTAEEVHKLFELHGRKKGTPTMGGIMIIGGVVLGTLLCARWDNVFVWVVLLVFLGLGALGFMDDYTKVVRKNSKGVSARAKLVVQLGIALAASIFLCYSRVGDDFIAQLYVPFLKNPLLKDMGLLALAFFTAIIVGSSNAVNLTDGLDGLATGCTITVALAYGLFCYAVGRQDFSGYLNIPHHPMTGELAIVCAALVGASLGFLWYNCHPARVFMGDTSSLAIGGLLGTVAICCKQELTLVIVGFVFVMEAASVMLQVASFKLRGGKRIFRMSPIHHHFELGGWAETTVVTRFWILSVICALIGVASLKLR